MEYKVLSGKMKLFCNYGSVTTWQTNKDEAIAVILLKTTLRRRRSQNFRMRKDNMCATVIILQTDGFLLLWNELLTTPVGRNHGIPVLMLHHTQHARRHHITNRLQQWQWESIARNCGNSNSTAVLIKPHKLHLCDCIYRVAVAHKKSNVNVYESTW